MDFEYILTIRCPDRLGIVAAVTTFLVEHNLSITESHQYQDPDTTTFYMRIAIFGQNSEISLDEINAIFAPIAAEFVMAYAFHDKSVRPRVLLLVSRFGHCLYDLLHRWRSRQLAVDIVGVVSNHDDMRSFVEWSGIPYHHLPVTRETKAEQEARIHQLVELHAVDLVVLARYMQVLSPDLCAALAARCINIHHSFLPSFKGAKPYHQAHGRGVKIIGATAHYVTTDLDEGPIIEQDVQRVSHARSAAEFVQVGQDIECAVLARAVRWHVDHRVLLNGHRTVVFE